MVYMSLAVNLIGQRSRDVIGHLSVRRDVIGCEDFCQRHIYHLLTFHFSLDSEDDFRSGCCSKRQSKSPQTVLLRTTLTRMIINLRTYDMTAGFKPFTKLIQVYTVYHSCLFWREELVFFPIIKCPCPVFSCLGAITIGIYSRQKCY